MVDDIRRELRKALAELTGHAVGDRDYCSYFENAYGERIVFVREPGKEHGVMLHSDLDWEPKLVAGPPKPGSQKEDLSPQVRRFLGDVPVVGDVILNRPEALWLKACLAASDGW